MMNQDARKYQTAEATKYNRNTKRKRKCQSDHSASKQPCTILEDIKPSAHGAEKILCHKLMSCQNLYEVQWKNLQNSFTTWEPLKNLHGCIDLLYNFYESITDKKFNKSKYKRLKYRLLSGCNKEDTFKHLYKYRAPDGELSIPCIDNKEIERRLKIYCSLDPTHFRRDLGILLQSLRKDILTQKLFEERQQQLADLNDWENEINCVSTDTVTIFVENNEDLEPPPQNFFYINDYLPGEGIIIPDDPPLGCKCSPHCSSFKRFCCVRKLDGYFAYNHEGLLKLPIGSPIYECNKKCSCDISCTNRVVQKGRKVKLCIFRTSTGCGWGVKTVEDIKKGMFITEFLGEVISNEEAERRGKLYDTEKQTYLFDLDFNDKNDVLYTVDSTVYGNVSHFINHSCSPNMSVYAVWINCLDPNLPKLALFAIRDIKAGEELTIDYLCQSVSNKKKNGILYNIMNESDQKNFKVLCKCGSKNCRKFLFFNGVTD